MQITLYALTAYVGLAVVMTIFGSDAQSRRAARVLHELLNVIKKIGGVK